MQTLTVGVMSDEAPRKEVNKGYHKDAWLTLVQKIEENVDRAARLFLRGVLHENSRPRPAVGPDGLEAVCNEREARLQVTSVTVRLRRGGRYFPLLFVLLANSASACLIRPHYLYASNQELVRHTPRILIARVTSINANAKDREIVDASFETVSVVKGRDPKRFTLLGFVSNRVGGPGDFDAHKAPEFWAFDVGNTIQPGDGRAYGMYALGQQYLIFLRKDSHVRAYENVKTEQDLWLRVVKVLVAHPED